MICVSHKHHPDVAEFDVVIRQCDDAAAVRVDQQHEYDLDLQAGGHESEPDRHDSGFRGIAPSKVQKAYSWRTSAAVRSRISVHRLHVGGYDRGRHQPVNAPGSTGVRSVVKASVARDEVGNAGPVFSVAGPRQAWYNLCSCPWGCSSAGRALASHVRGQGFESPHLHH